MAFVVQDLKVGTVLDDYFSALTTAAESAIGQPLQGGTVVAPGADRAGSGSATSYPTPLGTIVWCDPALVESVTDILSAVAHQAIDSMQFVHLATSHGATLSGFGNNRVLVDGLRPAKLAASAFGVRRLDRDNSVDRSTLAGFIEFASEDDLDEADLEMDNLDPYIVGVFDDGKLVAYGSGRPSEIDERFDDIGVLTHADHRGQGLGALVVSEFVGRRLASDPSRRMLYRCTTENGGSNAIAKSLGFSLAHTIGAVRFN